MFSLGQHLSVLVGVTLYGYTKFSEHACISCQQFHSVFIVHYDVNIVIYNDVTGSFIYNLMVDGKTPLCMYY